MTQNRPTPPFLDLIALRIDSPQGFLSALGLLRVCAQDLRLDVRLSWVASHARLHGIDRPTLLDGISTHMRGRSMAPEFNFLVFQDDDSLAAPVSKLNCIRPEDYRTAANNMRDNPRALAFLAAFATDAIDSKSKPGFVTPNKLDFSAGQQKFVDKIRNLADELDPARTDFEARLRNALFGGPYEQIKKLSFGWDPVAVRRHACEAAAPTDSDPPCQPFSIWFAIEALPLHPILPVSPHRAETTGFNRDHYDWPQWSEPLTLEEVRLLRQRPVDKLRELEGVQAIWRSAITRSGKYLTLSAAERTPGYRPDPKKLALGANN
jgi:hypothetical protein